MPTEITIYDVPDHLVRLLGARAERNRRSLQAELRALLEDAVLPRQRLTPADVLERVRALGLKTPDRSGT